MPLSLVRVSWHRLLPLSTEGERTISPQTPQSRHADYGVWKPIPQGLSGGGKELFQTAKLLAAFGHHALYVHLRTNLYGGELLYRGI